MNFEEFQKRIRQYGHYDFHQSVDVLYAFELDDDLGVQIVQGIDDPEDDTIAEIFVSDPDIAKILIQLLEQFIQKQVIIERAKAIAQLGPP
ncbi:MAG: hypothetical protein ACE5OZ_23115 [Candidatus Heimdallarchaeota archaeon]